MEGGDERHFGKSGYCIVWAIGRLSSLSFEFIASHFPFHTKWRKEPVAPCQSNILSNSFVRTWKVLALVAFLQQMIENVTKVGCGCVSFIAATDA